MLVGLLAFHAFSIWSFQIGAESLLGAARERSIADRLGAAKRAISELAPPERDRASHALSSPSLDVHWTSDPTVSAATVESTRVAELRRRLVEIMPDFANGSLRLGYGDDGVSEQAYDPDFKHSIVGALQLPDGSWLNFKAALFRPVDHPDLTILLSTSAMAMGIVLVSILLVRSINRPLRELSIAADRVGRESRPIIVAERGPREVRQAAHAFNEMQDRIAELIRNRTRALAAVSHDLKTPITRLRLRAGLIEDAETQMKMKIDADLDEMEAMIEATLAYLRGETDSEPSRAIDLVATLSTLCNAAADTGADVVYAGPSHARIVARPLALKRAIGNLINNALASGGAARVSLGIAQDAIEIIVDDDGPGIPEAEQERVFEPFYRLETSVAARRAAPASASRSPSRWSTPKTELSR